VTARLGFFVGSICDVVDEAYVNWFYNLFTPIAMTEKSMLFGLKSTAWIAITVSFLPSVVVTL